MQYVEELKDNRAKNNTFIKLAKSIEINKQNRKMYERLHEIHNKKKTNLSRQVLDRPVVHPGAPLTVYKKNVACKIDEENQRLLKAIVFIKP